MVRERKRGREARVRYRSCATMSDCVWNDLRDINTDVGLVQVEQVY